MYGFSQILLLIFGNNKSSSILFIQELIHPFSSVGSIFYAVIDCLYNLIPENAVNLLASKPITPPQNDAAS